MGSQSTSLLITVIGAGIAGLSSAIGLRRAGHVVTVYERSSFSNEIGAAIHVCPNAARIVLSWGLDPVQARFVTAKSSHLARGDTLERFYGASFSDIESTYHAPWYLAHRVDLHSALKRLAIDTDAPGRPVEIITCAEVVAIDKSNGSITLADSSTVTADLVVAADGVHSQATAHVLGYDVPAVPTGMSAFRFLIPRSEIAKDASTAHFLLGDEGRFKIYTGAGDRRLVWYPCRDNTEHNFVAIHPDNSERGIEEWNVSVDRSMLLSEYDSFHPSLLAVCRKASDVKLWKLLYRSPLESWHQDRLVLVGDAAHPMLPHQGQGGAQAIEDGAALEVAFSAFDSEPTSFSLGRRLELYERIRKDRASAIQVLSNAGQDEAEKVREAAKKYVTSGQVPTNPTEFMAYNFSFDVYETGNKLKGEYT